MMSIKGNLLPTKLTSYTVSYYDICNYHELNYHKGLLNSIGLRTININKGHLYYMYM